MNTERVGEAPVVERKGVSEGGREGGREGASARHVN